MIMQRNKTTNPQCVRPTCVEEKHHALLWHLDRFFGGGGNKANSLYYGHKSSTGTVWRLFQQKSYDSTAPVVQFFRSYSAR